MEEGRGVGRGREREISNEASVSRQSERRTPSPNWQRHDGLLFIRAVQTLQCSVEPDASWLTCTGERFFGFQHRLQLTVTVRMSVHSNKVYLPLLTEEGGKKKSDGLNGDVYKDCWHYMT